LHTIILRCTEDNTPVYPRDVCRITGICPEYTEFVISDLLAAGLTTQNATGMLCR